MNQESLRTSGSVDADNSQPTTDLISAEEVLRRYANMVYRLALARVKNRHDAEDILQEVFLRYIRSKPACRDEEHRKAWLIRTAINCSKSLLTSAWFRRTTAMGESPAAGLPEESGVYEAVMALPLQYRTVVHLFYFEDYSIAEMAALLQRKEATIKTQLFRARERLRSQLKGEMADV